MLSSFAQWVEEYHEQAGINHRYIQRTFNGGGAAFFDYDNDGDDDLYVTGGTQKDALYLNNGDGTFTDIADQVGLGITALYYTAGVNIGDFDNDGRNDIYVTTIFSMTQGFAKNLLFYQIDDGTFREIWDLESFKDKVWSMGSALLDYDLDGDLDIYTINYIDESEFIRDENGLIIGFDHTCFENRFYRNDGDLRFTEIADEIGLADTGCGLAVTATDYDLDGDMDIILANDFGEFIEPNRLYRNEIQSLGVFVEEGQEKMGDLAIYAMGIAIGDLDNDLDFEYYFTNIGRNVLLANNNDAFEDVTTTDIEGNVYAITDSLLAVSWGANFFDIENDGDLDLYVANGYVPSSSLLPTGFVDPDQLYINEGGFEFKLDTHYQQIANILTARGTAMSDFDNDGDIDFFTVNFDRPATIANPLSKLYRNIQNESNNWIKFRLEGILSNRNAYGAKVYLFADGIRLIREVSGGSSHCSHNSSIVHFGIGKRERVDSVIISWPGDNRRQKLIEPDINQTLFVLEDTSSMDVTVSNEILSLRPLGLFPNPSSGEVYFQGLDSEDQSGLTLSIFDIGGRRVLNRHVEFKGDQLILSTSELKQGIYLVQIKGNKNVYSAKLVISD